MSALPPNERTSAIDSLADPASVDQLAARTREEAYADVPEAGEFFAIVEVVIVDARTGVGVEHVVVELVPERNLGMGIGGWADREGRVVLGVPPTLGGTELKLLTRGRRRASHRVEPLQPGERRKVRIELPPAEHVSFHGRVVDDADGTAIAGAEVVLLQLDSEDLRLTTDADGWFEASIAPDGPDSEGLGRVQAAGKGCRLFVVRPGYDTRDRALHIGLATAASIAGRVTDAEGGGVEASEVVLTPIDSWELATEDWRQGVPDIRLLEPEWSASTRPDGSYRIEEVPAGVRFEVRLEQEDRRRRVIAELRLEPGEERRVDVCIGEGATVHGLAVDAATGEPVPGLEITLATPKTAIQSPHWFLGGPFADRVQTDETGGFRFEDVPAGSWRVCPSDSKAAPACQLFEVVDRSDVDLRLEVHFEWTIEGTILREGPMAVGHDEPRPGNREFAGAFVHAEDERGVLMFGSSNEDRFVIDRLVPGSYTVWAETMGGISSTRVQAAAGDRSVVLQLPRAGGLHVEWPGADPGVYEVVLRRDQEHPERAVFSTRRVDWPMGGLVPGLYSVLVRGTGTIGFESGIIVRAGATTRVDVALMGAARISIASGRTRWVGVLSDGALVDYVEVAAGLRKEVMVPPGNIEIATWVDVKAARQSESQECPFEVLRSTQVAASERVRVDLE